MTIERIVNRLIDCAMRLHYRQWERWELLALGSLALFLLVSAVRVRRKIAASEKHRQEHAAEIHT